MQVVADPYPVDLPPLPTPLSIDPIDSGIESPNDAGPSNRRPVASKTGQRVSYSQNMSGSQWTSIYTFWRDTLNMGSLPFDLEDPQDGVVKEWIFKGPPQAALFRGDPDVNLRGYRVTVNAEILP